MRGWLAIIGGAGPPPNGRKRGRGERRRAPALFISDAREERESAREGGEGQSAGMGDSGGSVVSVDVERISFGGKVRPARRPMDALLLSVPSALWGSFGCCCWGWVEMMRALVSSVGMVTENFLLRCRVLLGYIAVRVSVAAFRQFICWFALLCSALARLLRSISPKILLGL
jgi:hypothetical protein